MPDWSINPPEKPGWFRVKWEPDDPQDIVYVGYVSDEFISWGYAPNDDPESISRGALNSLGTKWQPATEEEAEDAQRWFDTCYN